MRECEVAHSKQDSWVHPHGKLSVQPFIFNIWMHLKVVIRAVFSGGCEAELICTVHCMFCCCCTLLFWKHFDSPPTSSFTLAEARRNKTECGLKKNRDSRKQDASFNVHVSWEDEDFLLAVWNDKGRKLEFCDTVTIVYIKRGREGRGGEQVAEGLCNCKAVKI